MAGVTVLAAVPAICLALADRLSFVGAESACYLPAICLAMPTGPDQTADVRPKGVRRPGAREAAGSSPSVQLFGGNDVRLINRMADRVLAAVVPEISAGACCSMSGESYGKLCECTGSRVVEQTCTYGCHCKVTCGPCRLTGIPCS
jgi:hypothetical protein